MEWRATPLCGLNMNMEFVFTLYRCKYKILKGSDHVLNISDANLSLGSNSGIVLAVPISKEEAASGEDIENAIQQALKEAR